MFSAQQLSDLPSFSNLSSSSKEKKSKRERHRSLDSESSQKKRKTSKEHESSKSKRITELEENERELETKFLQMQAHLNNKLGLAENTSEKLKSEMTTLTLSHQAAERASEDKLKTKENENEALCKQLAETRKELDEQCKLHETLKAELIAKELQHNNAMSMQMSVDQGLRNIAMKSQFSEQQKTTYFMSCMQITLEKINRSEQNYQTQIGYYQASINALQNELVAANAKISPTFSITGVTQAQASSDAPAVTVVRSRYPQALFQPVSPPLFSLVQPAPVSRQVARPAPTRPLIG